MVVALESLTTQESRSLIHPCQVGDFFDKHVRLQRRVLLAHLTNFTGCTSRYSGGAISVKVHSKLTVSFCRFESNQGEYGAGIYMYLSFLNVTNSEFKLGLSTTTGGGITARYGSVNIQMSTFQRNNVSDGDGGALYFHACDATIRDVRLLSNRAKYGGGLSAKYSSFLNVTNISLCSNVALERGGGMEIGYGSSLLCTHCEFRSNEARWGGGMYAQSDDSILVVAQLRDSTFMNNTAYNYGGKSMVHC